MVNDKAAKRESKGIGTKVNAKFPFTALFTVIVYL